MGLGYKSHLPGTGCLSLQHQHKKISKKNLKHLSFKYSKKNKLYCVLFKVTLSSLLKGVIPATPSGTATLLRLSPSYRFYPRQLSVKSPSSGTLSFHGLTGGVYKVRERIHRAMADARLLAIPPS